MKAYRYLCLFIISSFLGACSTSPVEIFNKYSLDDGESFTTGSRQRIVNNTYPGKFSRPGQVIPSAIVCSEPSPDVAVAVANSFGVGISIMGQGAGSMSASQAEGLIQLAERTVTIQLLREQMFRACESYSNGAINGTTYSLLLNKLNETIVTLMLGETAGGAFGRGLGAIGTKAEGEAEASMMTQLAKNVEETQQATDDLAKANENVETKDEMADLAKANAADNPTDDNAQETAEDAQQNLTQAEKERDAKEEHLKDKIDTLAKTSAEVNNLVAGGGITNKPGPEVSAALKEMQHNFLKDDFQDSYVSACLIELGGAIGPSLNKELAKEIAIAFSNYAPDEAQKRATRVQNLIDPRFFSGTALADHCRESLPNYVKAVHADKVKLEKYALDIKLQETAILQKQAQTKSITEFNKGIATCDKLKDAAEKNRCIGAVVNITAGPSVKPVSFAPQLVTPIQAWGHYKKAAASKTKLGVQKTALTWLTILSTKAKEKAALEAEKRSLLVAIDDLLEEVDKVVIATTETQIVQLKNDFVKTQTEIEMTEIPSERKLKKAELNKIRLESQVWVDKLKPLKNNIDSSTKKAKLLIQKIKIANPNPSP